MLVDGEDARDKVAILVEDQPGFPLTEGRSLGEIVDLDVGLIDKGMKCTWSVVRTASGFHQSSASTRDTFTR